MATGFELIGGVALVLGLATRFFSLSLIILTLVAIMSVHWPESWSIFSELIQGYVFTDKGHGNFKLPVLDSHVELQECHSPHVRSAGP